MPENTQVPVPRPPSDRFPVSGQHARTKDQRIPTMAHLLPAWYPKDLFGGEYYRDQMGDNTIYHDEASKRHEAINAQNNRDRLYNFEYKQEAPHDRHTPLAQRRPGQPDGTEPLHPTPQEISEYEGFEIREPNTRGEVRTGQHK